VKTDLDKCTDHEGLSLAGEIGSRFRELLEVEDVIGPQAVIILS
jgi:hypothetical protein